MRTIAREPCKCFEIVSWKLARSLREISTFIAEVQAIDKGSVGLSGLSADPKGNGKKLAKVCVKVAMQ